LSDPGGAAVDAASLDKPLHQPPSDIRRARVLQDLDPSVGRGLEIGPLFSPVVSKDEADVCYVDVYPTPVLRDVYADNHGLPFEDFVDVDCALEQDGEIRSLSAATAAHGPFDWVVASHVIEHVPDVISWLADVADVLVDDGRLVLAVPDRRFCFDACRPATTVGEMLLAHHNGDTKPSVRAIFDHYSSAVSISASDAWSGMPGDVRRIHDLDYTRGQLRKSLEDGQYVDCHVWLFTPASFVEQLSVLAELGHLDFVVESMEATAVGDMEFHVTLRRLPRRLSGTARAARLATGFPPVPGDGHPSGPSAPSGPSPVGVPLAPGTQLMALSDREVRALSWKRTLGGAVWRVLRRRHS
jgi:SAM-dependent methyltransferase